MRFLLIIILFPFYCFSQDVILFEKNIEELSSKEKFEIIKSDINNLGGSNLGNYLNYLKFNKIRLNKYNSVFIEKAKSTTAPFDLYLLVNELLNNKKRGNKMIIQHLLIEKQKIWDVHNWSEEFWTLIKENNFEIGRESYYTLDSEGKKKYDIENYFKDKLKSNELGDNPLLYINYEFFDYEPGKLLDILKNLEIKEVDFLEKEKSVKLFGTRGVDGWLKIYTIK